MINNKSYEIDLDGTIQNVKKYKIQAKSGDSIVIRYHGELNGKSGAYPYVREKTIDEFYILREETRYFPIFRLPDSIEYINNLLNPKSEDEFELSIKLLREGNVCSNLLRTGDTYIGSNPTIAVGYFETKTFNFGQVHYSLSKEVFIQELEKLIKDVEKFMSRYLVAKIDRLRIILIPDNYGSFVINDTLFLEEKALTQAFFLIHELIHTKWNPKVEMNCQRTRFFDEALTQYFTFRMLEATDIQSAEIAKGEFLTGFEEMKRELEEVPPLAKWGEMGVSDLAYNFGPLIFIELEKKLGRKDMDILLARLLNEFKYREVDFEKFIEIIPKENGKDYFRHILYRLK